MIALMHQICALRTKKFGQLFRNIFCPKLQFHIHLIESKKVVFIQIGNMNFASNFSSYLKYLNVYLFNYFATDVVETLIGDYATAA